jgi:hypothetical protein
VGERAVGASPRTAVSGSMASDPTKQGSSHVLEDLNTHPSMFSTDPF